MIVECRFLIFDGSWRGAAALSKLTSSIINQSETACLIQKLDLTFTHFPFRRFTVKAGRRTINIKQLHDKTGEQFAHLQQPTQGQHSRSQLRLAPTLPTQISADLYVYILDFGYKQVDSATPRESRPQPVLARRRLAATGTRWP